MNTLLKLKDYHRFVGVDIDKQGRVWFATGPKGIIIYDPSNQSVSTPFPADSALQLDVSDVNSAIYCDRSGIIWLGTWLRKGFYQLNPYSPAVKLHTPVPKFPPGFFANAVISIAEVGSGDFWLGTGHGLYDFNKQTGEIKALDSKDFPGLKLSGFIAIDHIDHALNIAWAGTDAGYFQIDTKTQICRPVTFKDNTGKPLDIKPVTRYFAFRNTWAIFGPYNDRAMIFTGKGNDLKASEAISFSNDFIDPFYTTTDNDHLLFIKRNEAAGNLTFSYVDGKLRREHHKMDSLQWTSIFCSQRDKTYWVAAENKLFHYSNNFKTIRTYAQTDGLPDLEIRGLIADNNGDIWFHTDRSINQLNVATGEISTLTENDGFERQDFGPIGANCKDNDGDIYFPGGIFGSGFDRITPGKYTNPPSSLYLQSLEINQKTYLLTTGINNLAELSLRYNENKITIETGIIDDYSKGTSHMRYKLEGKGVSGSWQYGPANYAIRFEGLQPGSYKLHMQASNAALQFNGPEKILLINISPPWWQTWWAYAIFVLVFAASIWAFVYYRSLSLLKDKRILEHKVQERTEEVLLQKEEIETQRDDLEKAFGELKTTQTQLIQSEKMASLGELTAGIAHEIQNPLNFVNNFSEVSIELLDEMETGLNKGDKEEVIAIAADIRQNLEKINQHGKRADGIVKGMLQHSKASTGTKESTNINALADEYMKLAYHGLKAKDKKFNAELIVHFDKNLPHIKAIPQDIGRVFLNLFNNAFYSVNQKQKLAGVDYKPKVSVTTLEEKGKIIIKVHDNGTGIPDAIKEKIMQPFFTTKPTGEGTGLGLSLTYDMVVKGHRGSIEVNTKAGEYAEFIVSLPV